ncbi:MAG: glycosyltransferase [Candidatus Gracilibacteria bacterium]|jgi:glycosyltransferase involved in cell wall biosynthesis|nr:glycosyltransferase [Candidatus Gracilibacteria bacterium]
MKKIAIVVQRFGEEIFGGAERHAFVLAKKLSKHLDVTVLTTCAKDYYSWKNEYFAGLSFVDGIRTIRFETDFSRNKMEFDKFSGEVFSNPSDLKINEDWMKAQGPYSSDLFDFLSENDGKYDAFVFMTYLYASTVFGSRRIQKSKKFLIPTAHDEKPIYLPIFKDVFSCFDGLIFNTDAERTFVHTLFPGLAIPEIVMGISVEVPDISKDSVSLGKRASYIGRIEENKGLGELFDYWEKVDKLFSAELVVAGERYMKIPKDVKYLGKLSEDRKYKLITESTFIIVPSKFESLSLLLLEAFSQKKPVLVNGKSQVLTDHCLKSNGGLWYDDFEDFEQCVKFLLENEDIACKMGENGYRYFKENYDFEVLINKFLDFVYGK